MKLGPVEEQEKFDIAHWKPFEELFDFVDAEKRNDILTDFYYRYLICKTEYIARKMLYVHFTKYVDEFLKKYSRVELVSELTRYARFFISIIKQCADSELEESLMRFRQLGTDTAIPMVLKIYDNFENGQINKTNFVKMLRLTESFVLRRFVLRMRSRGYGLDFAIAREHINSLSNLKKYYIEKGLPTDEQLDKNCPSLNSI